MEPATFKNHYFLMRHGESMPNVRGVILSDLDEGKKEENTLTANGEQQVCDSAQNAKEQKVLNENTILYSSPFSRCKRTAEIARDVLGVKTEIIFDDRLRERWFGDWEGKSNVHYQNVWDKDIVDPNHKDAKVESTSEVIQRVTSLIHDLESNYTGKNILLVSHGDALQILQIFFEGAPSSAHRELPNLKVAEIRKVN